jgi:hypothetical protein
MQAIVMYSGGIGSWAAGLRAVERYGVEHTTLLFCDTKQEDEDLYTFLHDGAKVIGVPVTKIADGRTPWEAFRDKGFLGNARYHHCSFVLKREVADRWLQAHYPDPASCVLLTGMDFCQKEQRRLEAMQQRCAPYTVDAPLFWSLPLDKDMAKLLALKHGLRLPRLYTMGFAHNNCGGACVKAGQEQWATLYRMMPERYRYHMEQEEALGASLGKRVSILVDRVGGGKKKPLSLRAFADRLDRSPELQLPVTYGDCNCFA